MCVCVTVEEEATLHLACDSLIFTPGPSFPHILVSAGLSLTSRQLSLTGLETEA